MSQLRILMLSDFYPPDIGGAQRQTQLLGRELARRGHAVAVATVWQAGLPELHDDVGVPVHRLKSLSTRLPWFSADPRRRHHPPFPDPAIVYGLRRLIGHFQPDVVHSYGWISYSAATALLGQHVPLIISARTYAYTCALSSLLRRGAVCDGPALLKCLECAAHTYGAPKGAVAVAGVFGGRLLLRRKVAGVHSISTFVRETIRRDLLGGRDIPDAIIPSFRESVEEAAPGPVAVAGLPDEPYILFVGALTPHKGLGVLLAAYERLSSPPPLVLIGTVRGDTPRAFPPGVVVRYDVPHREVMAAWERCLFGVSPSLWPEPFGSVVHEAMSRGKAMIGTTPGGHADMIDDGRSGLLVPSGDVDALARAMRRLIDDAGLRERLGRAARESAGRYTADVMVPRFEAFYRRAARLQGAAQRSSLGGIGEAAPHPNPHHRGLEEPQVPPDLPSILEVQEKNAHG
ncbi:MAG TPA: glycosyltransferase family 4 protein [Roseiflexaceae bacterium]